MAFSTSSLVLYVRSVMDSTWVVSLSTTPDLRAMILASHVAMAANVSFRR